jgi:hypothetical protein
VRYACFTATVMFTAQTDGVIIQQDRQYTCKATLRRVRLTIVAVGKAISITYLRVCVRVCVCVGGCSVAWECTCARVNAYSLAYPACNAYAPYCDVICGHLLRHIVRNYVINGTIFGKKLLNTKCVCFDFLYNFYLKHFSF